MIYMFLSNNPLSGDINSSNLSCYHTTGKLSKIVSYLEVYFMGGKL